ncbi:hypothetical protein [Sphingobium yanoikuyae]|uniref:hypothetical protein n=1 Tax=Sphingobium yanoikuyae TaxID=13690 RepID=UPI0012D31B9D|nr:hypothetical protein [Sphingobium yanoikuyae]MDV3479888.1 hypothetical protein [Sphingobium yanoikuyae]
MDDIRMPDGAQYWALARAAIEEHGDEVSDFLNLMVDDCMQQRDFRQLSEWFLIQNCVGMILNGRGGGTH